MAEQKVLPPSFPAVICPPALRGSRFPEANGRHLWVKRDRRQRKAHLSYPMAFCCAQEPAPVSQKQEEAAPNPGPLYLHDEQDMNAERRRVSLTNVWLVP